MISNSTRRLLPVVCLLSLAVCILVQAPAQLLYVAAKARLPELQASAVNGSAWRGAAFGLMAPLAGQAMGIDKLEWVLRPSSLLRLRPAIDFEAMHGGQTFTGRFQIGTRAGWSLLQTEIRLPVANFESAAGSLRGGNMDLQIDTLTVRDNVLVDVSGRARLRNVTLQLAGSSIVLPDITADLEPTGSGDLRAVLSGSTADLFALTGELLVNRFGKYRLETVLTLAENTDARLGPALSMLGEQLGNRQYRLVFAGDGS